MIIPRRLSIALVAIALAGCHQNPAAPAGASAGLIFRGLPVSFAVAFETTHCGCQHPRQKRSKYSQLLAA